MSERAIHLADNVIPYVPTRHWVLSVPFELRYWMAADDRLLKKVNEILCSEIRRCLRKKAKALGIVGGETGVVSYLQRAGSALNLNLHFHLLVLDGLYVDHVDGRPLFQSFANIQDDEVGRVVEGVSRRVIRYLRELGKLAPEGEEMWIAGLSNEEDFILSNMKSASISSRIALGPRAGMRVRRIGRSFGYEEEIPKIQKAGCASKNGLTIHAATAIKAHERERLEQLLRYLGRGTVAEDKISLDPEGNVLYQLKKSYDGATHVLFSSFEFIEKLASIIPPPYKHQVNYYSCLSSRSKLRPLILVGLKTDPIAPDLGPNRGVPEESLPEDGVHIFAEAGQAGIDSKPRYIPWAELLKRTFGMDLRFCPLVISHINLNARLRYFAQ